MISDKGPVTHIDNDFNNRINAIANKLVYGVPLDSRSNPYEVIAAKLLLRWEIEETIDEEITVVS